MKQLSKDQFELAREFMRSRARGLERALFEYEFEAGSASNVYKELALFQNEDGGFGKGIEPDLRCEVFIGFRDNCCITIYGSSR